MLTMRVARVTAAAVWRRRGGAASGAAPPGWVPRRWCGTAPPVPAGISPVTVVQQYLQAFAEGDTQRMELFLHHDMTCEQAPSTAAPKGAMLYKYDFLKAIPRLGEVMSATSMAFTRVVSERHTVVVECRTTSTVAVDIPAMKWKRGHRVAIQSTMWFDLDPQTSQIVKIKTFECPTTVEEGGGAAAAP